MPNAESETEFEKPVVQILVAGEVAPQMLDYIGWGLEEEGIPASLGFAGEDAAVIALARQAACESRLHVGIGVSGRSREAALHHRDLSGDTPVLTAPVVPEAREALIRLGKNAARLVKGNPFCLETGTFPLDGQLRTDWGCSPELLEKIVAGVVERLRSQLRERRVQ